MSQRKDEWEQTFSALYSSPSDLVNELNALRSENERLKEQLRQFSPPRQSRRPSNHSLSPPSACISSRRIKAPGSAPHQERSEPMIQTIFKLVQEGQNTVKKISTDLQEYTFDSQTDSFQWDQKRTERDLKLLRKELLEEKEQHQKTQEMNTELSQLLDSVVSELVSLHRLIDKTQERMVLIPRTDDNIDYLLETKRISRQEPESRKSKGEITTRD
ncbi:hypothetical protein BLNAU_18703 [Blattamonas nauphoetae]|uniref:Uncharacterized protein n=1 Tax=Blattamonas nauphoetae TaxID=2049346 RepID=A0ABQ9X3T6_9EUKA|nr:hypothetical protein BLNAU_18703 [Blattamonas nauphoetae]